MTGFGHYLDRTAADTAWMAEAACKGVDPALFFPERGDDTKPAKAVCQECPVRAQCLEYALDTRELYGVWGGESERSRRRLRRGRGTGRVAS